MKAGRMTAACHVRPQGPGLSISHSSPNAARLPAQPTAASKARREDEAANYARGGPETGPVTVRDLTDAQIRTQLEQHLLDPSFATLVDRVEAIWQQLERDCEDDILALVS